jgi:hypothetical protein
MIRGFGGGEGRREKIIVIGENEMMMNLMNDIAGN